MMFIKESYNESIDELERKMSDKYEEALDHFDPDSNEHDPDKGVEEMAEYHRMRREIREEKAKRGIVLEKKGPGRPLMDEGKEITCRKCGATRRTKSTKRRWCCSNCGTPQRNPYFPELKIIETP
jgi:hypothetical protein